MAGRATIGKWGNSRAIRLSKEELDRLGLREGDEVEYELRAARAPAWDASLLPVFRGPKDGLTFKDIREQAAETLWNERHGRR